MPKSPRTSSWTATAVLTSAALLALSACGGSNDSGDDHKIHGARSSSPTPTSSATAGSPEGAPAIKLPSDVKVTFDKATAKDAKSQQALSDLEYSIKARLAGMALDNPSDPALLYSWTEDALVYWAKEIEKDKKAGRSITGEYRYYDLKVHLRNKTFGTAEYCEDQHAAFAKSVHSNKVYHTKPSKTDYVYITARIKKNNKGVWRISTDAWTPGSAKCI